MFQHILVLTDLTDTTRFAFRPVAALAKASPGAKVVLAHAVVGTTEQFFLDDLIKAEIDRRAMTRAQPRLDALVEELRGLGVDADGAIEIGSPYNVLFRLAEHHGSDLIVVPTRHQHSVVRRVSNSVTARAIRAHSLPVMTMNQRFGERAAPLERFAAVLHPIDFGPDLQAGLQAAVDFAAGAGARLELVHVLRRFDVDTLLEDDAEASRAAHMGIEAARAAADAHLRAVAAEVRGVATGTAVLLADSAGEGIVAHAHAVGADCVVLPALGRDKVHTLLMGSTAEYILSHADCPVLFHDGKDGKG